MSFELIFLILLIFTFQPIVSKNRIANWRKTYAIISCMLPLIINLTTVIYEALSLITFQVCDYINLTDAMWSSLDELKKI